jgi:hypothetical protein
MAHALALSAMVGMSTRKRHVPGGSCRDGQPVWQTVYRLFDHSRSGWIGAISLSLPAVGCALLLTANQSLPTVACAMLILGYAAGAYLQLCTYLTSRYAGLRGYCVFALSAQRRSFPPAVCDGRRMRDSRPLPDCDDAAVSALRGHAGNQTMV